MANLNKSFWSSVAEGYSGKFKGDVNDFYFGPTCPPDSKLHLLPSLQGKRVLELGCGTGHNAVYLAKHGARVTAIDFSHELIQFAKQIALKNKVKIDFIEGDITKLDSLVRAKFDIVVSVFSLQYVDTLPQIFKKIKKLLVEGGTFIFSIDHPFFRTVSYKTFKVQEPYWKLGKQVVSVPDGKYEVHSHTIESLVKDLTAAGLRIDSLSEPKPVQMKHPWNPIWGFPALANRIPPVLIIVAK
jgi:2-polyprenyl-3-methyl-5-hydroxy-6-metoxy-1,4-benzoquinol methylase